LRLQLAPEFLHFGGGEVAQEFGYVRAFVFFGEREQIKRRNTKTFGQTGDRMDRNGGETVFDAGKVALGKSARIGESPKGQTLFAAEFANAGTNLESKRIGSGTSGHGLILFGLPFWGADGLFHWPIGFYRFVDLLIVLAVSSIWSGFESRFGSATITSTNMHRLGRTCE
jgi:hypothetical protein